MRFRWLAWACVSSVWRSLDTPKSSLPFSSVCFQTWSFLVCSARGHPHTLFLYAISTTRAGHGSRAGEDTSVFQSLSACLFGHRRIQGCSRSVFLLRLDWNDSKARVATVRAGEVPLPTSGLLESSTQHPFFSSFFLSLAASVSVLSSDENTWGHWGMAGSPTCAPGRLFSYALWLAEGATISGKRTREAWWTAGVPLCRETASPLWPILPLTREPLTASAVWVHTPGKIGWSSTK